MPPTNISEQTPGERNKLLADLESLAVMLRDLYPNSGYTNVAGKAIVAIRTEQDARQTAETLLQDVFDAFDGVGISHEIGSTSNGRTLSIGGIRAFLPAEWVEPEWRGMPWDSLTAEQRVESAKFSAQHALIKRLAELRTSFTARTKAI